MKRIIVKCFVFIVLFIISLFVISGILNKGNTDMTTEMGKASLPLIYMNIENELVNCLHGYTVNMKGNYLRDTLTPLEEDRSLTISIDKYGVNINHLSYEVRSVDGKRLVESTKVLAYKENDEVLTATFTIKDLIEKNTEYSLIILIENDKNESIRYYTRIIHASNYYAIEKLKFVKYFNSATFNKVEAENIARYLESNSEGDNTTFGNVNIHSSFKQITWGDMRVTKVSELNMSIKEIANQTATILGEYIVSIKEGSKINYYRVKEFYRVKYTSDRMYLLSFERTMSQVFDENSNPFIGSKIMLGIQNKSIDLVESDGGNMFAFVVGNQLFSYNVSDNKFAVLFGFYNENNKDLRTVYDAHDIKILNVDETGNVRFMVFGYMNRGRHEGTVGIQVYLYNSLLNTIEEEVYIPYNKSYELLKVDVTQLSYVSKLNYLYLMLDCSVYEINLDTQAYSAIANGIEEGNFEVSNDNCMIVVQKGEDINKCTQLMLMNLNTQNKTVIEAGYGNYIKPLGFMEKDLIYGIAKKSDIYKDKSGLLTFAMHTICIQNEIGEILKEYIQDDVYVTKGSIVENQLVLSRVRKNENGEGYLVIEDDQILNNAEVLMGKNNIEIPTTETFEKITQIAVKSIINLKTLKILTPKEVLFEGGREIAFESEKEIPDRYYVYGLRGAQGVFTDVGNAINLANNLSGVVLNDSGSYVWIKGNRSRSNQIMAISGEMVTEDKNSIAICLNTILKLEGIMRNTENLLNEGEDVLTILEENLVDSKILDLSGCTLDSVLYYVNKDIPVLAILNDGNGVLIIGFNETQIVLMDPLKGTLYKKGITEAEQLFSDNGKVYISYVK
ncbi:MAG TPA: hypothetical protein VJZ04_01650 [Lachnospiraceae bacterium]|nr:hypothetical protein [Lachnospiraceae bacterium]